jgi:pimeloyl-ACP methyl ester carboxylesterase
VSTEPDADWRSPTEGPGDGLPGFVQGRGDPVVFLPGLSFTHGVPTGPIRAFESGLLGPLSRALTLHWTSRRVGVPPGYRMADFAADYADDIRRRFDRPMPVIGFSTGGSIGLQLALDHPEVVERLVVVAADARLSDGTRASNLRWIDDLRRGDVSAAWQEMGTDMIAEPGPSGRLRSLMAAAGARMTPEDCTDGMRTAEAELDFDLTGELARIPTPTLLVVGTTDASTSPGAAMRTQASLPAGEVLVLPHVGHLGSLLDRGAIARIRDFVRGSRAPDAPPPMRSGRAALGRGPTPGA